MEQFNVVHVRKKGQLSPNVIFTYKAIYGEIKPRGGITIAWNYERPLSDGPFKTDRQNCVVVKFGIAECSDEEVYNKKTGRDLAFSRLGENILTVPTSVLKGKTEQERYYVFKNLVMDTVSKILDITFRQGARQYYIWDGDK